LLRYQVVYRISWAMAARSCVLVGFVAVAILSYVMSSPSNTPWLHLLSTYPVVEQYTTSRMLGSVMKRLFAPAVAEHQAVCNRKPNLCTADSAISSAINDWPCVIHGAFDPLRGVNTILQHFGDEYQNQFVPCEEETPLAFGREAKPCLNITFSERVRRLEPHHSKSTGWAVFTKVLTSENITRSEIDMLTKGLKTTPELTHLVQHSSIWPHLTVFMSRNESAVPHFHSHPDYFVNWNVAGAKEWLLLPPAFIPEAKAFLSGMSFIASIEPDTSCAVSVVLKPGDALIVPSFWLHRTLLVEDPETNENVSLRHLGYSHHFASKSSIGGYVLAFMERLLGPNAGYQYFDVLAPSHAFRNAIANLLKRKESIDRHIRYEVLLRNRLFE